MWGERDLMVVSKDENDDGDEGDDFSQRQPVQQCGQLHNKNVPQPIAKRGWLVDGPLPPKRFPHRLPASRLHDICLYILRRCSRKSMGPIPRSSRTLAPRQYPRLRFTTFSSAPPASKRAIWRATYLDISSGSVSAALCGVSTTFGWVQNGLSTGNGSVA